MKEINTISVITIVLTAAMFASCERGKSADQSESGSDLRTGQRQNQSHVQAPTAPATLAIEKPIAPWKLVHTDSVRCFECSFAYAKAAWPDNFERQQLYLQCAKFAAEWGEWANPTCSKLGKVIQREEDKAQREIDKQAAKDHAAGYR